MYMYLFNVLTFLNKRKFRFLRLLSLYDRITHHNIKVFGPDHFSILYEGIGEKIHVLTIISPHKIS